MKLGARFLGLARLLPAAMAATSPGDDGLDLGAAKRLAAAAARNGLVIAFALTWMAFWGLVARLQLLQGEFLSAAVTGVALVLPAVVGLAAYLHPRPASARLVPG